MSSSRFVDEVYGGGGYASAAPTETAADLPPPLPLLPLPSSSSSQPQQPSAISSLFRSGVVWVIVASILAIGIAASIVAIRFKMIESATTREKLDLAEQNTLKQQSVLAAIGVGAGVAAVTLVVTRIALKWHF